MLEFSSEFPTNWIAGAEVYFGIQDTRSKIKVGLAQLCKDGSTIPFFKAMIDSLNSI